MHKVCLLYFVSIPVPLSSQNLVHPIHLAFVLINEGAGETKSGGSGSFTDVPLFVSVIQRAGGDPVRTMLYIYYWRDPNFSDSLP